MGIVVHDTHWGYHLFLQKRCRCSHGERNDWLEEETANMAREGLRTLVTTRKRLSGNTTYNEVMSAVVAQFLEHDLESLGLTGWRTRCQVDIGIVKECWVKNMAVDRE